MFIQLVPNDAEMAEGSLFEPDEVQYNLLFRIREGSDALCLKTADGSMIFAHTPGHKGWLWISQEMAADKRDDIFEKLAIDLKNVPLPGITGNPDTVERFAEIYSKRKDIRWEKEMTMESYYCPKVLKPNNVRGTFRKATKEEVETVALYLAGFLRDAFNSSVDPVTQLSKAETMIEAGGIYLWLVDGKPVSMANISHRTAKYGRINSVFTPIELRKKGYASALTADLCAILEKEKLIPMLYADIINPASNKVYQNIGFLKSGKITEIKFQE
ncbi:GNAT family N-acetyltransferase [Bacillus salipaludis]|uniref:GNAT family N-acetyltransferase n=1 Tax=Bacillus salipaludis TaxID=2547811 RepID=A0ABW8RBP1_9BACI